MRIKLSLSELRQIIQEEVRTIGHLQPPTQRVAATREGELKVWLDLVGPRNLADVLRGEDELTDGLIAALRAYDAKR
jgi:hypothetical protein